MHALVDELRMRMGDELDYRIEAANQTEFVERYRDHPFIAVPAVIEACSTQRVLTTDWVDGRPWADFLATADRAGPSASRRDHLPLRAGLGPPPGVFNGDPTRATTASSPTAGSRSSTSGS